MSALSMGWMKLVMSSRVVLISLLVIVSSGSLIWQPSYAQDTEIAIKAPSAISNESNPIPGTWSPIFRERGARLNLEALTQGQLDDLTWLSDYRAFQVDSLRAERRGDADRLELAEWKMEWVEEQARREVRQARVAAGVALALAVASLWIGSGI